MLKKVLSTGFLMLTSGFLFAQDAAPAINAGDTAWMIVATAFVMLMTPAGLALFYGGLSSKKSVLNTVGMSYVAYCVATVVWVLVAYSLTFSEGNSIIGDLKFALLHGISVNDVHGTIPTLLFVAFQGTFAAIAVAIVSGSIIERVKFSSWIIFSFLWVLLVYAPIAHWVWGGGFLSNNGELDFAGGTVIHINAGVAGLVLALMLGKRKSYGNGESKPISLKLTVLGSALLWFGWFGFNAGSQLAADGIAANALLVTNVAACAGGLAWLFVEWMKSKTPGLLGISSGVVAGLVGITPAAGFVDVSGALAIGFISGIIGYFGVVKIKQIFKYDDSLDAFGIHGLVGIWGSLATGIFANPAINEAAGLLYGNPGQVLTQLIAVLVTIVYSAVGSAVIFKLTSLITKSSRVTDSVEEVGMDKAFHAESGFHV
jgi:Amt family ammonium transporter